MTDPTGAPAAHDAAPGQAAHDRLQELARRHLWRHCTRMGRAQSVETPVIVSGDGCYVTDSAGRRYLDGLSGLFVSQVGYGRRELAEVAAALAPMDLELIDLLRRLDADRRVPPG
jgi:4-aminobutyrate aminotransferase-like enzyme